MEEKASSSMSQEGCRAFFGGIGLPPAVMGWAASCDDGP